MPSWRKARRSLTDVLAQVDGRRRVRGDRAGAGCRVRRHRRRGARPHPWHRNRQGRHRDDARRRHGVPHRVDDQELHGGDRVAPPRRGAAAAGRPCRVARPGAAGTTPAVADAPSITIRRLLSMSAGFPGDDPWGDRQQDLDRDSFSEFLEGGQSFVFMPGTAFEYSNLGTRSSGASSRTSPDRNIATSFGRECWNRWA